MENKQIDFFPVQQRALDALHVNSGVTEVLFGGSARRQ